jgi:hypothetical protein
MTHEDGPMRRSVQVDEHLKIGFDPTGEKPDTFTSRALKKAGATSSAEISELCKRWAEKWDVQNGRAS